MDPSTHDSVLDFRSPREQRELAVLARYLSGECDSNEEVQIRKWIAENPARQRMAEQALQVWTITAEPSMQWNIDRVWQGIQERQTTTSLSLPANRKKWYSKGMYARVAAVLACVVIAAGAIVLGTKESHTTLSSQSENAASSQTFATRRGQRSIVRLADGTEITLAADSRVRVPDNYGRSSRDIYLEGTAYFSVQHDAARPFIVHTRFGETLDLATQFIVTAYPTDTIQQVIVADGRVLSAARGGLRGATSAVLNPGDAGTINGTGKINVRHGIDTGLYTAWTRGELKFSDTPLRDVLNEFERWYDVTIVLTDPRLAQLPLTLSVGHGTIDDALQLVERVLDVQYVKQGSHVRISRESLQ